ncbi:nuclear transport factor 2 family protein [Leeuwenhoekiella marinoflava]|uniref:SnoaL-like protein n=2 Tax=Leeuwenhoekiella marinoflava TaxID=988 RepID=A0A4Q0PN48_9FLAO|nr:nuclear transport factor 2 family protein [Leeuwenhoekiella marinoflava]RXG31824.1 SnoaL-like protein [Leeuwenhoekiella marinoflava]SHF03721.1 SnoaL-like domain-containing protein [Leeuwenhoekiella marinoflava DSM 3653]
MDIDKFIQNWLQASNDFDTERYLAMFHTDAVLDDPSVGKKFIGHQGIKNYFESYFIGYNTQTRLVKLNRQGDSTHLEVTFTGDFPEGKIRGTFDFIFQKGKISFVKADLVQ